MPYTTHILLFVECGRGEGNMLFSLDLLVGDVIKQIADRYDYDLNNGDAYALRGQWKRTAVLNASLPLYETELIPNEHVFLVITEPRMTTSKTKPG